MTQVNSRRAFLTVLGLVGWTVGIGAEPADRPAVPLGRITAPNPKEWAKRPELLAPLRRGPDPAKPEWQANGFRNSEPPKKPTEIPFDRIDPRYREIVRRVVRRPIVYRRSKAEVFPCSPRLLDALIDHPEVVNEYWRTLGVELLPIERNRDAFHVRQDEFAGVKFRVVHTDPQIRVILCEAEVRKPPLFRLGGECVLIHHCKFMPSGEDDHLAAHQTECWVSADGPAVKTAMRLARGSVERAIDDGLEELMMYFSLLSRMIRARPEWAQESQLEVRKKVPAAAWDGVKPALDAEIQLARKQNEDARQRLAKRLKETGQPLADPVSRSAAPRPLASAGERPLRQDGVSHGPVGSTPAGRQPPPQPR